MQSTLRLAGIEPVSDFMRVGGSLAPALGLASWVLCGGADEHRRFAFRYTGTDTVRAEIHRLLPLLASVEEFREPIRFLDGQLEMPWTAKNMPAAPAGFVAGYLSILPVDELDHVSPDKTNRKRADYLIYTIGEKK